MPSHNRYPTKAEILAKPVRFREETIRLIESWKSFHWPNSTKKEIQYLLLILAELYQKPLTTIRFNSDIISSCYNPKIQTIFLKDTSLITALHEFAHHIYGRSEFQACRWSIWLFAKVFPEDFKKLTWKGHLLIKCPKKLTT